MIDWRNPTSLKNFRTQMHLRVDELSAASGVSASQIYRIEAGMGCRAVTAAAIEEALAKLIEAKARAA